MSGTPLLREHGRVTLHDLHPRADDLCADVLRGLSEPVKKLPPKYFYDERGAELFERITELDAYYLTSTELSIIESSMPEIARAVGPHARIVEFGSGSGVKTRLLLDSLDSPTAYLPIDISRSQLLQFALSVAERFPHLEVLPVCTDYTRQFYIPATTRAAARTVAFFPGSTIGNFEPHEAEEFLLRVGKLCGPGGGLLIGVDLQKDLEVIERAYNDPEGVTAAFNLNLLERINRECGADFDLDAFRHNACYDEAHGRIEMHLVCKREHTVHLMGSGTMPGAAIHFDPDDRITTEYSYKYTPEGFRRLVARAGWGVEHVWTDEREWFAVILLSR